MSNKLDVFDPVGPLDYRLMGEDASLALRSLPPNIRSSVDDTIWRGLMPPHDNEFRAGWRKKAAELGIQVP